MNGPVAGRQDSFGLMSGSLVITMCTQSCRPEISAVLAQTLSLHPPAWPVICGQVADDCACLAVGQV